MCGVYMLSICNSMDCSLPGSSVHGSCPMDKNSPGKNTGVVAISYSRGSSWTREQTHVSSLLHWRVDSFTTAPPVKSPTLSCHVLIEVKVWVAQSCLTLCNPMDCGPPSSSVHGILQARVLQWAAISSSRRTFWPRDQTWVSCIAGRFFTVWAIREAHSNRGLAREKVIYISRELLGRGC